MLIGSLTLVRLLDTNPAQYEKERRKEEKIEEEENEKNKNN